MFQSHFKFKEFKFLKISNNEKEFLKEIKQSQILKSIFSNYKNLRKINELHDNEKTSSLKNFKKKKNLENGLEERKLYETIKFSFQIFLNDLKKIYAAKKIKKKFYISNQIDSNKNFNNVKIINSKDLISHMNQMIIFSKIENKTMNNEFDNTIKRMDKYIKKFDINLFNFSRKDFISIKNYFSKFFILSLIFSFLKSLHYGYVFSSKKRLINHLNRIIGEKSNYVKWNQKLIDYRLKNYNNDYSTLALKNLYNLPKEELVLLTKILKLKTVFFFKRKIQSKLNDYHKYLNVDNYYLCGLNGFDADSFWSLNDIELFNLCLERNLIKEFNPEEHLEFSNDFYSFLSNEYRLRLRFELLIFLSSFSDYGIGYLGINHILNSNFKFENMAELFSNI